MNGNLYEERGEDRRIRKSKKALQEALIRLLSKKSIGEITIKELTDEADVHRGTFYHHYADAMDLKVQTEREMLVSWIEDGMRMAPGEMARIMERMMGSQSPTAMSR